MENKAIKTEKSRRITRGHQSQVPRRTAVYNSRGIEGI